MKKLHLVFGAVLVLLTACSKKQEAVTELNSARTIRIADQTSYFNVKVALEKGFFKEEFGDDYKFELSSFLNGPAINETFTAGLIDFAQMGDTPIVQAVANEVPEVIVSTVWISEKAYGIVTSAKSPVKSLNDLKGTRIGIQVGTNPHKFALKVLKTLGLSQSDVQIINVPNAEVAATLSRGDVDSATIMQPAIESTAESAGGSVIAYNGGYNVASVYNLVSRDFAKNNPQTVARILKVLDRADKWLAENPDEASEIVASIAGSTKEKMYQYLTTRTWVTTWKDEYVDEIQDTIDFALAQGSITVKLNAKDFIDTSFVKEAGLY